MRVLALDLGEKRVGLALSDVTGTLASPHGVIGRTGDRAAEHAAVARVVDDEAAALVVVGHPINMDGSRGPAARAAEVEASQLRAALPVPVILVDERLTTVAADRILIAQGRRAPERRRVVDQTAAALLLQGWLDGPAGAAARRGDGPGRGGDGSVEG